MVESYCILPSGLPFSCLQNAMFSISKWTAHLITFWVHNRHYDFYAFSLSSFLPQNKTTFFLELLSTSLSHEIALCCLRSSNYRFFFCFSLRHYLTYDVQMSTMTFAYSLMCLAWYWIYFFLPFFLFEYHYFINSTKDSCLGDFQRNDTWVILKLS